MLNKNLKQKSAFLIAAFGACLVSFLLFFTPLDNKLYDLFLRFLPPLTEDEKVFVLTLDDASMDMAGGFPFKREIMADIVVLLKELGVEELVFDLSYLDESAQRFDVDYAMDVFNEYLFSGSANINNVASVIPMLGRDVDDYFARALSFSDNSWLTLTMTKVEDIFGDEANIKTDPEIDEYLAEVIAPKDIIGKKDTKTPRAAYITPAIMKLLPSAKGAGSVNAGPDSDGLYRRVHLLWKYQDNYYKNLTFAAIKNRLNYDEVEVSNRAIVLKRDNGDIRIPRTKDGSILIKWPKKVFYDYNFFSLLSLIQHNLIESDIALNLEDMHDSGIFYCWDEALTPWDHFLTAENLKKEAFANHNAVCDEWFIARQEYLRTSEKFLYGEYEEIMLEDFGADPDLVEYIQETFELWRAQFSRNAIIREEASVLNGSFCVIGSDATSMTDHSLTTFQENYPNVGSYAVVANMLLSKDFLNEAPWFVSAIIAIIFSLLICFIVSHFDTHFSILAGVGGILFLTVSILVFFIISKVYIGLAVPLVSASLTFISIMVTRFLTASHEKAFLHNAFSRYLAPEVIAEIINDPSKLNLGGEKREMTAIFTDIQGFSTISEQLDPTNLVSLLNRYLTLMSNIIMENIGTIDKYEGDAIIAFFGAPVFREDHAVLACRSAIAMKAVERELNKTVVEEGLSPFPLFTRIGINTGVMVVGNMGAENKMDYTIMGNSVNLAARLEGVNKQYRTGGILISEYTREKLGDEFILRRLDRVRVVGINTPLRLYELLNLKESATESEIAVIEQWEQAIDLYEQWKFRDAVKIFKEIMDNNAEDKVAELYATRCMEYIAYPPPPKWDAINNLTEK